VDTTVLQQKRQTPFQQICLFARSAGIEELGTEQVDIGNMAKTKTDKATRNLAEEPRGYEFLGP
jgi:hypothetical protein